MLVLLSPAKTLNWSVTRSTRFTLPHFVQRAEEIVAQMRTKSKAGDALLSCIILQWRNLKKMMSISDSLAELNHNRFQTFQTGVDASSIGPGEDFKQALLAFDGPVCKGIDPESLSDDDLSFAQDHVRLLSGLYGILRPLDLIQPYRLEMGSKGLGFSSAAGGSNTLYEYWGEDISNHVHNDLTNARPAGSDLWIVNLASQEYAKAACIPQLQRQGVKVLQCVFKDEGRVMSMFAKRARGLMTRYILDNRVTSDIDALKQFDVEGYQFSERESSEFEFVFNRPASRRPPPMRASTASKAGSKGGSKTSEKPAAVKNARGAKRTTKNTEDDHEDEDGAAQETQQKPQPTRKRTRK